MMMRSTVVVLVALLLLLEAEELFAGMVAGTGTIPYPSRKIYM
jgi:hypothetical protein